MQQLILASSSPYRRSLLERLGLPFACVSPDIDESPLDAESAERLSMRLALAKAKKVAEGRDAGLIIASDQVCRCEDRIFGKPGDIDRAREQLRYCRGRSVEFHTALVLYDCAGAGWREALDLYCVRFRQLTDEEIERYLALERPFDCAGSFKAEGLGIALFDSFEGRDFHSLIGLPLLSLCALLREAGLNPLLAAASAPA